jgi:ribosomal protein S18 acetylase RimI-like enzyme
MSIESHRPPTSIDQPDRLSDQDLADLCEAAETAVINGGGFGWLKPPPRKTMEAFWKGVLLVPDRTLFVARTDGRIAGSAILSRFPRNNEAQRHTGNISNIFVAPWARGRGLARGMVRACELFARKQGIKYINLDVRSTQIAAVTLYEALGYLKWGENPHYAVVNGQPIKGLYYTKRLKAHPKRVKKSPSSNKG